MSKIVWLILAITVLLVSAVAALYMREDMAAIFASERVVDGPSDAGRLGGLQQ